MGKEEDLKKDYIEIIKRIRLHELGLNKLEPKEIIQYNDKKKEIRNSIYELKLNIGGENNDTNKDYEGIKQTK